MNWFKRLLEIEARPRGLAAAEIERLRPKPPRPPKSPRPVAEAPQPLPSAFPPCDGDYRFLALDVETANQDMASICQIGVATVSHSGEVRSYSTLINPRCRFVFTSIHGIDAQMVREAPTFPEVFPSLLPLLERHAIFQHSTFDKRAVDAAHAAMGAAPPNLRWIDSVRVARQAWPEFSGAGGHGLAHLKTALKLDFQHHDAGEDARAAAQVVLLAERRLGAPFDRILSPGADKAARPQTATRATFAAPISLDGAANRPLTGRIAVFTGELSIPREVAAARAAAMGLSVRTSVSRKSNFVIVGGPGPDCTVPSGKHRRARELAAEGAAIRIIGEADFLALLACETPPPDLAAACAPRPTRVEARPEPSRTGGEIVVIACAPTRDVPGISARAEALGMTVMVNVTKRTTLVVVAEADLVDGAERTTRHRSAEAALANGQSLRIICEAEFLALMGAD
jgi:DNA polymerase-3 subunit epsilon